MIGTDIPNYLKEYDYKYDEYIFDNVMKRMLDRIPDTLDKREGSVIWDALAPAAFELENLYIELDYIRKNSFANTADREHLIRRAEERGITPLPATFATVKAKFNREIPLYSRFNYEKLNYFVTAFIKKSEDDYIYELRCEQEGTEGNITSGRLTPIDDIQELRKAEIIGLLIPARDIEDTEDLRTRYFESVFLEPFGGNIDDYVMKVKELAEVGGVKVYPVWQGGGTVKITIIDNKKNKPTDELVQKVQELIDPVKNHGKGMGIAPIGHTVTVVGAEEIKINLNLKLAYEKGYTWENVKDAVIRTVTDYIVDLKKEWQRKEYLTVRQSQIEARILNLAGILDITECKINGQDGNLSLKEDEIPAVGVISNE